MKRNSLIIILLFLVTRLVAQQITPFVIASAGMFGTSGNMILSWTAGETFGTTLDNGTHKITQGFHQPMNLVDTIPFGNPSGFIPTGITPNGDGLNDAWVIDGLDTLKNTVYVFNRWGDVVWKANDYNNNSIVWKGDNLAGELLPSATYFFVIVTDARTDKGWIELLK